MHDKRSLGAYYTPAEVSSILCRWAIRKSSDQILEPSFGGCTFLDASIARLEKLGQPKPGSNIFGCDIDDKAFKHLNNLFGGLENHHHFFKQDFLEFTVSQIGNKKVNVIIGNPPYIGHRNLKEINKKIIINSWKNKLNVKIGTRSSLWVYFLVHSLEFLQHGGRLAFVLPGSFLSSNYSSIVHEILSSSFKKILAISLTERIFLQEGAEERSVLLFADDFQPQSIKSKIQVSRCDKVTDVGIAIEKWEKQNESDDCLTELGAKSLVKKEDRSLMSELKKTLPIYTLGSIVDIRIGFVVGDKKFFIRSRQEWEKDDIKENELKFVMSKFKGILGISLDESDCKKYINQEYSCLLLNTNFERRSSAVNKYIDSYPAEKISTNATYKKRKIWHQPDDGVIPDFFMSFLLHNGPRLICNNANVNATNSVHRVFLKEKKSDLFRKILAISILSTYSQLSAEIVGRACGSGALKLEPNEANKLEIIIPNEINEKETDEFFTKISKMLSLGMEDEARRIADKFITSTLPSDFGHDFSEIESALYRARSCRKGISNKVV